MHFIKTFKSLFIILGERRLQSIMVVASMFAASMTEAIGLAATLPLLSLMIGGGTGVTSELASFATEVLNTLSLPLEPPVIVTFIVVILSLKLGIQFGARILVNVTSTSLEAATRRNFLWAVTRARPTFFSEQRTGEYVNSLVTEVSMYARLYRASCGFFASGFSILIYLVLSLLASWEATLVATLFGILIFLSLSFLMGVTRRAAAISADAMAEMSADLSDGMSNIKALKAMAAENTFTERIIVHVEKVRKSTLRVALSFIALDQAREAATILLVLPGFVAAIYFLDERFETMLLLALLFARTINAFGTIQTGYQNLLASEPFAAKAVKRMAEAEIARETTDGKQAPLLEHNIDIQDLSFSYGDHKVLSSVDLTINAHRITAVVGPSGSGKTTLADLIIGFLQPDAGVILVDRVSLADTGLYSWRREIGYVPQELLLFHDSIFNNITLFDPSISNDDVEAALRAADAWSFVLAMPHGLETIVGERGTKISGGQRQRLSLARALARRPRLLVLDEPTTALDRKTEQEICQTLSNLKQQTTILVISHQPAIIKIADIVYALDHGQVQQQINFLSEPVPMENT
jgi:ATP-binding cassette, subfamily C, bacterial